MTWLAGCWAKLNRAKAHMHALDGDIDLWRKESVAKGETMTIRFQGDPDTGRYEFFAETLPETPAFRWGLLVGDAIHNMRSALDHLAFSLADFNDPERGDDTVTQFPVARSRSYFRSDYIQRQIQHIDPHHVAMIEGCQPYDRDGTFNPDHPLVWLHQLDIADKHRGIHIVLLATDLWSFEGPPLRVQDGTIASHIIFEQPLEPGTKFMEATIARTDPDTEPRVYMSPNLTPSIALENGGMLKYVLPNLWNATREIIERF